MENVKPKMTMIEVAAGAVSFERLLGAGLLILLGLIVAASFVLAKYPTSGGEDQAAATLSFYKDMGLMVGTALVACLRGHGSKRNG